jgi:hypothetical protein
MIDYKKRGISMDTEFLTEYVFEDGESYTEVYFQSDFDSYPFDLEIGTSYEAPFGYNNSRFGADLVQHFSDDYVGKLLIKEHGDIVKVIVKDSPKTFSKNSNHGYH